MSRASTLMENLTVMLNKYIFTLLALSAATNAMAWSYKNNEINLNDTSKVYDLDEVTVIRQSKEQYRLRFQPLSSSMYSSTDLENLGTRDLRELAAYVPNFVMPNYGSRYTSSLYVRGIGSRVNAPAVGVYIDGMPLLSKSAFNFHSYDITRVDVLRGPQGTLYGLNTEGGIVRLYTRNPMNYQGTDVNIGFGTHQYQNFSLSHYNKVNDRFAFSVGGFYNGQHGFFRNVGLNNAYADKYKEAGGRLKLVFQPTERWNINVLADYQYTDQNGFPYGIIGEDGHAQSPNTNRQSTYRRNMVNTALDINFKANAFDFNSTTSYQYLRDYMLMDIDYQPEDYMYITQRQLQNSFSQEFTLKSNRPVGGFWRWTVGAFGGFQWLKTNAPVYFESAMDDMLSTTIYNAMYNAMLNSIAGRMIAGGMSRELALQMAASTIENAGGVSVNVDMQSVPEMFRTPVFNLGFYHESNFDITSRLTATLGLRYDYEHVKLQYDTQAAMSTAVNVMGTSMSVTVASALKNRLKDNFNQLLPKFALRYTIADNGSNVYATVSKGYRAGGYNIQMFSDVLETELKNYSSARTDVNIQHTEQDYENIAKTISYKPETSWNYEAGTHLNLFGNRVHLDFAAFYMQVRNQQLSVMAGNYGFGRMMVNAGKSESCGVELSLNGRAFDNKLAWAVSYGYTRATFRDYTDSVTVDGVKQEVSYKDNRVPYVPEHTVGASADYTFPFNCNLLKGLTLGVNACGQGKTYWDAANTIYQKFYVVMGAHAAFDFGPATLNFWARNLTSTNYNTFAVSSSATGSELWFAQRGNPFQWGADLKIHI